MAARGTLTTGTTRVTVAAPHRRVDVVLPDQQPVAELLPRLLSLAGEATPDAAGGGWALSRLGSSPLEAGGTLGDAAVRDGEVLHLRRADPLPEPIYDDVIDALATAVREQPGAAADGLARPAGFAGAGLLLVLLAVLLAVLPTAGQLLLAAVLAGALGVVLLGIAVSVGWALADQPGATAIGAAAVPLVFVAGYDGMRAGHQSSILAALSGLAVGAVAGVVALLAIRGGRPVFLPVAVVGGVGALALLVQQLFDFSVPQVAAIVCGVAFALIALLPTWSLASVRFVTPVPQDYAKESVPAANDEPVDLVRLRTAVGSATQILTALLISAGLVVLGCAVLIALSPSSWGLALVTVVALALVFRARSYTRWLQQLALVGTALVSLALVQVGLVRLIDGHPVWVVLPAVGAAAVVLLVATVLPRHQFSPFWGQLRNVVELVLVAAVIPVALGGLGAYSLIRTLGS